MKKIAFLFPGQGSQVVGMGQDFYEEFSSVRELFEMTEDITKKRIKKLCFEGPMEDLTTTVNLQPAISAVNLSVLSVVKKEGILPSFAAGHSLGEFSALCSAGALSAEDTVRIVNTRGELMHRESLIKKGAMSAVMGLEIDKVSEIAGSVVGMGCVSVANHNTEKQIVVTGEAAAVKELSKRVSDSGGRAIPLKVSGAWHSDLMKGAESEFEGFLGDIAINDSEVPVILNVTAGATTESQIIRENIVRQLCSPVKWYDSIVNMVDEEVDIFVEMGPGKTLSGMLKKILPKDYEYKSYSVNSMKTLETFFNDNL